MTSTTQADVLASTVLYCTKGSSNKEYHLALEKNPDGYLVRYANGKRGSTLTRGLKTSAPTSLEIAQKVYDTTLRSKLKDDYYPAGDTVTADVQTILDQKAEKVGFDPQLLIPIDEARAEELATSCLYSIQLKVDGERRFVRFKDGLLEFGNRKGDQVQARQEVKQAVLDFAKSTGYKSFEWDCEDMGDSLYLFDVLNHDGVDFKATNYTFEQRHECLSRLQCLFQSTGFDGLLQVVPDIDGSNYEAERAKAEFDAEEGFVFKRWDSLIESGTSHNTHFKLKFWKDSTVRVASVHPTKRSVALEVLDGDRWIGVGNVTIPVNASIPAPKSLIDVKYLYAYPNGGSLFEPSFKRVRTDLTEQDCTIEKLSYKKGSDQML